MADYDITAAFERIENELISSMIRNMARHQAEETSEGFEWSMWQAEQLQYLEQYKKANKKKYGKQFGQINQDIETAIREAYAAGGMDQEIAILEAIKKGYKGYHKVSGTVHGSFFRANERKLEALIKATSSDMQKAETAILRMANDQYRKVIYNAQVYANTGAGTYEKAVDMATHDMLAAGLNCVEYKNGARHTLKDYADMAIRTASKRAYLTGEGTKRQEWGISTVIVNKRGNPCPKCLPFCGKVLIDDVWSGGKASDGPYPLMSTAVAAGLYHPRCKDSHTTYFAGISTADDKWSREELAAIERASKNETEQQYAERQASRFGMLAEHSLDSGNKKKYKEKFREWTEKLESDLMSRATAFDSREAADAYYRPKTEGIWKLLNGNEKEALWKYTGSSYISINKALRAGTEATGDTKDYIDRLTEAIKKSRLDDAVWVRRGVSANGLSGLFNVDPAKLSDKTFLDSLVGKVCKEKGFLSTGVSKDAGFSNINLRICLPKGTQAIYAEPFSCYGGTNSNGSWDGMQKASYIGREAELIVQRGSELKIKEIKTNDEGKISEVVFILVGQNH